MILDLISANDRLQRRQLPENYQSEACDDHGNCKSIILGVADWIAGGPDTIEQSTHLAGVSLTELNGDKAFAENFCVLVQHQAVGAIIIATCRPGYRRSTFELRYVDHLEWRGNVGAIARRVVLKWAREDVGTLTMIHHGQLQNARLRTLFMRRIDLQPDAPCCHAMTLGAA